MSYFFVLRFHCGFVVVILFKNLRDSLGGFWLIDFSNEGVFGFGFRLLSVFFERKALELE